MPPEQYQDKTRALIERLRDVLVKTTGYLGTTFDGRVVPQQAIAEASAFLDNNYR